MFTIRHVDTCLPCYVLDHCNGETESLVGVPVDGATTYAELREALESEIRWSVDRPEGIATADLRAALDDLFANVSNPQEPFDSSLEMPDEEDGAADSSLAWFRVSWDSTTRR